MADSHWSNGNTVDTLVIRELHLGGEGRIIKTLKYTVTADDATAGTVDIPAGLTVAGFVCNVLRAGISLANADISASETNLVVATNSTDYVLTEDDVIQAIVWA